MKQIGELIVFWAVNWAAEGAQKRNKWCIRRATSREPGETNGQSTGLRPRNDRWMVSKRGASWQVGAGNEAICAQSTDRTDVRQIVAGTRAESRGVPSCSDAGGRRVFGGQCGLTHETCDIERTGEDIAPVLRLGTVGHAEPGRTIEVSSGLVGVAAFGITESTDAQVPGGRIDLQVTSQTYVVVLGQGGVDDDTVAQGTVGVSVRAGQRSRTLPVHRVVGAEVGARMSDTTLSAEPLAVLSAVVVPVEGEMVAVRTEGLALCIIAAFQAGEGLLVAGVMADLDRAQGVEGVVDKEQDVIKAFSGIGDHFGDVEARKATKEVLKAGDGRQMVVAIGGGKGARERPKGGEAIVDDVEGLVFVAKMMFAPSRGRGIGGLSSCGALVG